MMWAPIANNLLSIAVIVTYLVVYSGAARPAAATRPSRRCCSGSARRSASCCRPLILLPYLRASGFRIHPRFDFRGTGLGHTLRLGMWTVGFVIVNQLAFYVMVRRATSGPASGGGGEASSSGYTVYANAFLFTQVPHSIVTVSLATATMPLRLGDGRRRTARATSAAR